MAFLFTSFLYIYVTITQFRKIPPVLVEKTRTERVPFSVITSKQNNVDHATGSGKIASKVISDSFSFPRDMSSDRVVSFIYSKMLQT
jgi:hypothetical protein